MGQPCLGQRQQRHLAEHQSVVTDVVTQRGRVPNPHQPALHGRVLLERRKHELAEHGEGLEVPKALPRGAHHCAHALGLEVRVAAGRGRQSGAHQRGVLHDLEDFVHS
eukprot:Amastigsp_a682513_22.p3 type:complete len:108 gc:universal Amastigsp_a682513_22:585-262(-)